jgi:tRNA nucleotidyltransferase (CCA-adding enzyme)
METTNNKLSSQEKDFFQNLKNYIDLPLYFYGSVQRYDYLPQYSDIDVDIFTNDEKSIIIKLQNFLNVS